MQMHQNKLAIRYAAEQLWADRGFVLDVVRMCMRSVCASASELAWLQVRHSGCELRLASTELQSDKHLALEAVKQNGVHRRIRGRPWIGIGCVAGWVCGRLGEWRVGCVAGWVCGVLGVWQVGCVACWGCGGVGGAQRLHVCCMCKGG